jgi:hypothetical protein
VVRVDEKEAANNLVWCGGPYQLAFFWSRSSRGGSSAQGQDQVTSGRMITQQLRPVNQLVSPTAELIEPVREPICDSATVRTSESSSSLQARLGIMSDEYAAS